MGNSRIIQMQTNFNGLIQLLADGLYSTSDIFVRELVQNGHDSIIRRSSLNEIGYSGEVSIEYSRIDNTISFTDNGIGMDEDDIIHYLSVIGSSGTKVAQGDASISEDLIGQFGIGLLSSFLVASKVVVETRKYGCQFAYRWENNGSTDCNLSSINREKIGTTITVFVRKDFQYLLDKTKLEEIVVKYCNFITIPIKINGIGPVNSIWAPWDRNYSTVEQEIDSYNTFVNKRFPDMSIDVFPIKINKIVDGNTYSAQGVLYISNLHLAGLNTTGTLDIFVRKMLVKEGDTTLLPSWAKFVRGVVDSPSLKPTAGRDNINQDSQAFKIIQQSLGEIIIHRLAYLAKNRPDKFAYINQWHHENLKGMAMVNDDFFNLVADLLLFETNTGDISLLEYLKKNPLTIDNKAPIYYFSHYHSAAQYYRMANEKGITVINAGKPYDEELLEKYGQRHSDVTLEKLNELDKGLFFDELSETERKKYKKLEEKMTWHFVNDLRLNIIISTKSFSPAQIPAVIIETEVTKTDRELQQLLNAPQLRMSFGEAFKGIQDRIRNRPVQLALNSKNELINLLATANLDSYIISTVLTLLYNNALIYSHMLDEKNMSIVHDSVTSVMTYLVNATNDNYELQEQIQNLREEVRKNTQKESSRQLPDHIRMFMITPFAAEYKPVEQAVRNVFEKAPYFFEVRLARDYYASDTLVENVKSHMNSSHCFMAEISELNENVMMEVGGILMNGDPRPIFALWDGKCAKKKPADFGDKLTINYEGRTVSVEAIEDSIRNWFTENGRVKNYRLADLLKLRKKCFLSHTLLNSIQNAPVSKEICDKLCKNFQTIEDFLEADEKQLQQIDENIYTLKSLQFEIEKISKKS